MGILLFERTKRRVALTHAGRVLFERARENIAALERSFAEAVSVSRGESGHLSIGLLGSSAFDLLPKILSPFRAAHPGVAFRFRAMTITQQIEGLHNRQIDVGIVRTPVRSDGVEIIRLEEEDLMVALHRHHPLAKEPAISIRMLAEEPLLISARADAVGYYDELVALCARAGFTPKIACEAQPFTTLIGLVAAQMGIALLPAALRAVQVNEVVYRPLQERMTKTASALAIRNNETSPLVKAFVQLAQKHSPA